MGFLNYCFLYIFFKKKGNWSLRTGAPTSGPHTMFCCTRHLSAVRAVWSTLNTQYTVNLEYSNALNTQCTRSNGHSVLSPTHLTGTESSVRASCVFPCARESRRPPWSSLSLSLSLTRAWPRLDLPVSVSVLACDVRKPIETFGRELESVVPRLKTQKFNSCELGVFRF